MQSEQRLAYDLDGTGFKFRQGQVDFCSSQPSIQVLVPNQPTFQRVPGPFPGSKAAGAYAKLSPPYSAHNNSECALPLIPLFAFMLFAVISLPFTSTSMCFKMSAFFRFFYHSFVAIREAILSHVCHTLRPSHLF